MSDGQSMISLKLDSVSNSTGSVKLDATLSIAGWIIVCDLYVSFFTPTGSPRILDQVIILSVLVAITDSEDTVVESTFFVSTGIQLVRVVENSSCIYLEGDAVGNNSNRSRCFLDGSHQSR